MKALGCFRTIRRSHLSLALLFLLTCVVPGRLRAQAFGPPGVSANAPQWQGFNYYFSGAASPNGAPGTMVYGWFEWGTTASYGNASTPALVPSNGGNPSSFSANINGLTPNTLYHYRAAASNSLATGYSGDATFVTVGPPVITSQPQSQAVAPGSAVTFTVGASSGLPASYQWQKNGVNITSATTSTLTINSTKISDTAIYTAMVSNVYFGGWVVYSSRASLNVGGALIPILQTSVQSGSLVLSWPSPYVLQTSTNQNSTNWASYDGLLNANGDTLTTSIPLSDTQRFFRVH
jgi:hypothetical protein